MLLLLAVVGVVLLARARDVEAVRAWCGGRGRVRGLEFKSGVVELVGLHEMQWRYRGDAGEMQGRCRGGITGVVELVELHEAVRRQARAARDDGGLVPGWG